MYQSDLDGRKIWVNKRRGRGDPERPTNSSNNNDFQQREKVANQVYVGNVRKRDDLLLFVDLNNDDIIAFFPCIPRRFNRII